MIGKTKGCGFGTADIAPSHPDTVSATIRIHHAPVSIIHKAGCSSPSGPKTAKITAPGITISPMIGTANKLATMP